MNFLIKVCAIKSRIFLWIFLLACINIRTLKAEYMITAGGGPTYLSKFSSSTLGSNGLPLIKNFGLFGFDFEGTAQISGPFEIAGGVRYVIGSSNTQYNYINPDASSDTGNARNLSARNTLLDFRLGLRWHFLRLGGFSLYGSGGVAGGAFSLTYNQDEYKTINGDLNGFKSEGDSSGVWGYYGDAGLQIVGQQMGVRFYYRYHDLISGQLVTLENRRLRLIQSQLGILIFSKI